jgi:hypothetical protein
MPTWDDVLGVDGFSSEKVRTLLNTLVVTVPNARILEVGSYLGSTAVAMCFENDVECIHMVDNHSEFGDTRQPLKTTADRFGLPATIHDLDYFAELPSDVFGGTKFNVYLYDGPHDEAKHAAELAVAYPHLEERFLYIVDDYSWDHVRRGCNAGLAAIEDRVTVIKSRAYQSIVTNDRGGYWNGLLVALCEKRGG